MRALYIGLLLGILTGCGKAEEPSFGCIGTEGDPQVNLVLERAQEEFSFSGSLGYAGLTGFSLWASCRTEVTDLEYGDHVTASFEFKSFGWVAPGTYDPESSTQDSAPFAAKLVSATFRTARTSGTLMRDLPFDEDSLLWDGAFEPAAEASEDGPRKDDFEVTVDSAEQIPSDLQGEHTVSFHGAARILLEHQRVEDGRVVRDPEGERATLRVTF
jgi:hypothetical protein